MGKGRILVVEDDIDISNMLRIYFDSQGYEVLIANDGMEGLQICQIKLPNIIVLDIMLPIIDGYEVCKRLRSNIRTSYVPIIFLTQRDQRSEKIAGLELGADDYITKPFDIEELKLRVEGSIRRSQHTALTHPVTNLQAGKLIEEELKHRKDATDPWCLLYFGIQNVNAFKEAVGPIHVNEVLIFLADIMRETVEAHGTLDDFIGQASDNDFIIVTTPEAASIICTNVTQRFNSESNIFYPFRAREAGKISYQDIDGLEKEADFMKLVVGVVSSEDGPFADIMQITDDAAHNRRHGSGCSGEDQIIIEPIEPVVVPRKKSKDCFQFSGWPLTHTQIERTLLEMDQLIDSTKKHMYEDAMNWLDPEIKPPIDKLLDLVDESNQVAEFRAICQASVEMALAFIEIDSLTSVKIHDMKIIYSLLPTRSATELSQAVFNHLHARQQLCLLAFENLNELRIKKIHDRQKPESIPVIESLNYIVNLLNISHQTYIHPAEELIAYIPKLKLQQAIHNIFEWAFCGNGKAYIDISIEDIQDSIRVIFASDCFKNDQGDVSTLFDALGKNEPAVVYGYLTKKIIFRYGGSIELNKGKVILNLPMATSDVFKVDTNELRETVLDQLSFLEGTAKQISSKTLIDNEDSSISSRVSETVTDLIDPIARDLFIRIEEMLKAINSYSEIDSKSDTWSDIRKRLRFFRLLALGLQKNRPSPTRVNLKSVLNIVIDSLPSNKIFDQKILIKSEVKKPTLISDKTLLLQIFFNLALNALDAMPADGILEFNINEQSDKYYIVEVIDNGKGILPENLSRIADLYFSTKGSGRGRGRGLYTVRTYIEELRGQLEVCSKYGEGTTFIVKLPLNQKNTV